MYRRQREGVAQHRLAQLQAGRLQCDMQRIAAGGAGEAIALAHVGREFLFQQRRLGGFVGERVIAVQAARAHDFERLFDAGLGDRFLLGEGFGEVLLGHVSLFPRERESGKDPIL